VLRHGRRIFRFEEMLALAHGGEARTCARSARWRCGGWACRWWWRRDHRLVAVQSYDAAVSYTQADQELLGFAASQIATTLHRRRAALDCRHANEQLELRVQERTRELRAEIAERQRIQEQLRHQVMHDALTGLPNRGYLIDRLGRVLAHTAPRAGPRCALLYLDVDRFKQINDSLGHQAGDEAAARSLAPPARAACASRTWSRAVRRRIRGAARGRRDPTAAVKVGAAHPCRARRADARAPSRRGAPRPASASRSATRATPWPTRSCATPTSRCTAPRRSGAARFELFDEALAEARGGLAHDAGRTEGRAGAKTSSSPGSSRSCACPTGKWSATRRCCAGTIRSGRDRPGRLPAHRRGQRQHRGDRLDACSSSAARWCSRARATAAASSPSTSPRSHLRRADFDARLRTCCSAPAWPPRGLLTEVTEARCATSPERVRATLDRLSTPAVGTALDNFGSGRSSLDNLHRFPLRMLKIDRAFVAELGRRRAARTPRTVVCGASWRCAARSALKVVAEEHRRPPEELQALRELGCEYGQATCSAGRRRPRTGCARTRRELKRPFSALRRVATHKGRYSMEPGHMDALPPTCPSATRISPRRCPRQDGRELGQRLQAKYRERITGRSCCPGAPRATRRCRATCRRRWRRR
jgi:EAL domain-containing protein (putative c-di-GMP-specific phosphodiesterase class I)